MLPSGTRGPVRRETNGYQIYEVLCTTTFICVDPVNEKIAADATFPQIIVRIK